MKTKKQSQKLRINKTTVTRLDSEELNDSKGGRGFTMDSPDCMSNVTLCATYVCTMCCF